MRTINAREFSSNLSGNGDSNGFVTVADSSKFIIGAYAHIVGLTAPSKQVIVVEKAGSKVRLRLATNNGFTCDDMSAYLVADSAKLCQPAQLVVRPEIEEPYESDAQESRCFAVAVAALSATLIAAGNSTRKDLVIQNLGPNDIYIGTASTVTVSTGIRVPANGGSLTLVHTHPVYAICSVLQVSPNDTRVVENWS